MTLVMDPVISLKRPLAVELALCIFCQKGDAELRSASTQGIATIGKATESRKKLRDSKNRTVIDRLDQVLRSECTSILVWHKNCYSQFTDKNKILRLESQLESRQTKQDAATGSNKTVRATSRRSGVKPTDWKMCMFCQDVNPKHNLCSVMTFNTSNDILEAAKLDHNICSRLAGVSDLIAAEAKYHLPCLSSFKRTTSKAKYAYECNPDLPMIWLSSELSYAADKGDVLKLSDVWDRYVQLSKESNTVIAKSFISRRTTFREKLQSRISDFIIFVQPKGGPSERETLLVPVRYNGVAIASLSEALDENLTVPSYEPEDDIFLSLIHVALKLRGDLMEKPGHAGFGISEDNAISCIPESVYMFLKLLYGGPCQLEKQPNEETEDEVLKQKVISTAQDMIYGVSCGRKLTPKHIGLASTLHQVTRSKELVQLFHKAGHTLSYHQVMQLDTTLAEYTLQSMDQNTGAVIPPNLTPNRFVYYTADNIDILDKTLDGKDTFHATQVAAWQRGPSPDVMLDTMTLSTKKTLDVPAVMGNISAANMPAVRPNPVLLGPVEKTWYDQTCRINQSVKKAEATDLAFNIMRQKNTIKSSWTVFNESLSESDPAITTVGYMPIIQAPAHEFDTLKTVVERCMDVSFHLGQEYTVISVDQALYGKLMELKWSNCDYHRKLILRLGGLHISMNFLKAIGTHMNGSGLKEVCVEASIMGPNTVEAVLAGKKYNKAMRAHKLTLQALWNFLGPTLLSYVQEADRQLFDSISKALSGSHDANTLIALLSDPRFTTIMAAFQEEKKQENVNFSFWWGYMEMVSVLIMFTRALRDGLWELHLHSFTSMLPFFLRYDHYNYGRWGPVYVADMRNLPDTVQTEFEQGNFVVKRSDRKFNQVDPDQAQEWLNGTGKRCGGIVGITNTSSALNRWELSYNLRSHIAADTHEMFHIYPKDIVSHNEAKPARQHQDNADENALFLTFRRFQVFTANIQPNVLQNIATKDLASEKIQESLLGARELGQKQLDDFVKHRLLGTPGHPGTQSIYDPIKKNKASTFENLYNVEQQSMKNNKRIVMKEDKNVLQRLVTSYAAGRAVDLDNILKHELVPVPVALAEMNGSLKTGNKSMLADILTSDIKCPATIDLDGRSACLVIDGQARVVSIGKPCDAKTFGDLADTFTSSIFHSGRAYDRIDVVFDRYRDESIKSNTRQRRTKTTRPIRRIVEGRDVPLPQSWSNFLALPENKADLARFLSEELFANSPHDKEVVAAGGFADEQVVKSSRDTTNLIPLRATHEEADTRLILHAISISLDTVVVSARDTDVLLQLVSHFTRMTSENIWMMTGTAKKRKYIPIGQVYHKLPSNSAEALLPFHALTGCDTTSYFCGHTKRSAWKTFLLHHNLLCDVGVGILTSNKIKSTEAFVCRMYGVNNVQSVDTVRRVMFEKSRKPEMLPPTSNALNFHIQRVHYQCMIWKNAHVAVPHLPDVTEMGWKRGPTGLLPVLMT